MIFEESSYFLKVRNNDKNFFTFLVRDFSVKKSEKKLKKNNFFNLFRKKNTFLIFFNLIFSWKTDKLDSKLTDKNMFLHHINNLGRKITHFEYSKVC